jgi:hypothetical protein
VDEQRGAVALVQKNILKSRRKNFANAKARVIFPYEEAKPAEPLRRLAIRGYAECFPIPKPPVTGVFKLVQEKCIRRRCISAAISLEFSAQQKGPPMPRDNLSRDAQAQLADLRAVAEERLAEFRELRRAGRYAGAVYMGRYGIEIMLKCAICKQLGKAELPVIFHSHDLEKLIYFTGLEEELEAQQDRLESFKQIRGHSIDDLRYQNPVKVTDANCQQWDIWLNDSEKGIVPWLLEKLK